MSAEDRNWEQLFRRLDHQDQIAADREARAKERAEEQDELLKLLREHTHKTNDDLAVVAVKAQRALELGEVNRAAHQEHLIHHGYDDEKPPRLTVANLWAYAKHYPRAVGAFCAAWVALPTALALTLAVMVGPAGGLRWVLQQAGIRAVIVPTPAPSPGE